MVSHYVQLVLSAHLDVSFVTYTYKNDDAWNPKVCWFDRSERSRTDQWSSTDIRAPARNHLKHCNEQNRHWLLLLCHLNRRQICMDVVKSFPPAPYRLRLSRNNDFPCRSHTRAMSPHTCWTSLGIRPQASQLIAIMSEYASVAFRKDVMLLIIIREMMQSNSRVVSVRIWRVTGTAVCRRVRCSSVKRVSYRDVTCNPSSRGFTRRWRQAVYRMVCLVCREA